MLKVKVSFVWYISASCKNNTQISCNNEVRFLDNWEVLTNNKDTKINE